MLCSCVVVGRKLEERKTVAALDLFSTLAISECYSLSFHLKHQKQHQKQHRKFTSEVNYKWASICICISISICLLHNLAAPFALLVVHFLCKNIGNLLWKEKVELNRQTTNCRHDFYCHPADEQRLTQSSNLDCRSGKKHLIGLLCELLIVLFSHLSPIVGFSLRSVYCNSDDQNWGETQSSVCPLQLTWVTMDS